ncbi:MAG: hypothetical protein KJZ91_17385 [Myxococcales bacterium]|nr:hypothetical protein [Myxococcales bacterium]
MTRPPALIVALAALAAAAPAAADPPADAPPAPPPPPAAATSPAAAPGAPRTAAAAPAAAGTDDADDDRPIRPDPRAVAEAQEANLEPESRRSGLALGVAVGPNMQVGFGIRESSGTGAGFALRFGTVASPRWVWLVELASTGYQQIDEDGKTRINSSTLLTLGGQLYLKDAFWLRGGGGLASFARRTRTDPGDRGTSFWGAGVIGAGGLDLLRRNSFALSLEVLATAARYRDGTVVAGSMQLGFSWY